jgi:hypothetical protein
VPVGFFYLGPIATSQKTAPSGYIVKELVSGILGKVGGWSQVWNDRGSGKKTDFALWRALEANPDYISLASYFTRSWDPPTGDPTYFIRTVKADVLLPVKADYELWNDHGTGADEDGAVWQLKETQEAAIPGAFVAVRGYNNPPSPVYGLSRVQISTFAAIEEAKSDI